jgi:hypothetical protein
VRNGEKPDFTGTAIDDSHVLVLDYDLLKLGDGSSETGENLAYLARCFSTCGFIVGMNQFGENPFDLSLENHPSSFCDLNIGSEQLANVGLWTPDFEEFRPWVWPCVPSSASRVSDLYRTVAETLDSPVLELLGFDEKGRGGLPVEVQAWLMGNIQDPKELTFRSLALNSGNGLRGKDAAFATTNAENVANALGDDQIARISVSRVTAWLERVVMRGQDLLVDAPHLAARFPSLVDGDGTNRDDLNQVARSVATGTSGLANDPTDRHRFEAADWLSRPVWWWLPLSDDADIDEVNDPWNAASPTVAFCEDSSSFEDLDKTIEYFVPMSSPFTRRYVRGPSAIEGVNYSPSIYLAR